MIDGFSLSPLLCVAMIKNCWAKNESFLYRDTAEEIKDRLSLTHTRCIVKEKRK